MNPNDTYLTIAEPVTAELRERASKFLGYAFPLSSTSDWSEHLNGVKVLHPKATHHCFAFRINRDQFRMNDDGEPAGTAGRPILGQMDSLGLMKVLVVVVRYFGGTKLGVPGLIQAYKETARITLEAAEMVEAYHMIHVRIQATYPCIPAVMKVGKQYGWKMLDQAFSVDGQVILAEIRESVYGEFFEVMQIDAGGAYPDDLRAGRLSPDLQIEQIEPHD